MRKFTPNNITKLKPNQVFVFGSNSTGFHGAGAAGLACRGDSRNNWRSDEWFLLAKRSPVGSPARIGKWAVFGVARGFQEGSEGKSYAIETIVRPGWKRSIPLSDIFMQLFRFIQFVKIYPEYEFLVAKFGCHYAGYTVAEIAGLFVEISDIPNNVILPKGFEFRS